MVWIRIPYPPSRPKSTAFVPPLEELPLSWKTRVTPDDLRNDHLYPQVEPNEVYCNHLFLLEKVN